MAMKSCTRAVVDKCGGETLIVAEVDVPESVTPFRRIAAAMLYSNNPDCVALFEDLEIDRVVKSSD
jgi:hypothetical protein